MVVIGSHLKILILPYDPTLVSQATTSSPIWLPASSRETQFGYSNSSSSVPFSPSNHFGPSNPMSSSETRFVFSNSLPFSPNNIFYSVTSTNSSETQLGGLNSVESFFHSSPFSHENRAYSSETRFRKSNSNISLPLSTQNVIISPRPANFSGTSKGSLLLSSKNLVDSTSFANSSGTR
ncbi:hypothetical protein AMTRI_Chr10g226980 [Amborella trichopoda]